MGRSRFRFNKEGLRKGLAIAGVLVVWLLTLGGQDANAQALLPPGCVVGAGTITCPIPGGSVSCPAGGGTCTGTSSVCNGPVIGQFTGNTTSGGTIASDCAGSGLSLQNAANAARQASQVSMSAVQSQLQSIRDNLQRRISQGAPAGRPIGFAAEASSERLQQNPLYDAAMDGLLGYARTDSKSPLLRTPQMAAPALPPAPVWSAWGQGFGDWEKRTGSFNGIDIGRRTLTGGGLGGVDVTFSNFGGAPSAALVLGALGSGMRSTTHNPDGSEARVDGPGAGVYAIYVNGGFSTDATWKGDFLTVAPSTLPNSVGLNNYVTAWNIQYKFEYGPSWWEPTGGVNYTNSIWNSAGHATGFEDGYAWRVQAGVRAGTSWDAGGGVKLEPTITALAFEDVKISGGTLSVALAPVTTPTDQDKVFGLFNAKLNADYGYGLSAYVEGEVRGRTGVLGTAVRAGIRKSFQ
jgi:hypothetical protein